MTNKPRSYTLRNSVLGFLIVLSSFLFMTIFLPTVSRVEGVKFMLPAGASKITLVQNLYQQNLIKYPYIFSLYIRLHKGDELKAGEYLFPHGSTPASIWKQVTSGVGLQFHLFTIIPGWTFDHLRLVLLSSSELKHTSVGLDGKQIMARLGQANLSPEGEFFPETYYYTTGDSDLLILKRAFKLMQNKLNSSWDQRATNLPFKNAYEALIAASLVEKEVYSNSERPVVAGVLINRLQKNMLLQFDPTVIYGLGTRYDGKIHKKDLLENTPYNTYVHKGLPPTPIAMPAFSAIQAVLHPEIHAYFYFVAKGDGHHQFSTTLAEHHQAVVDANKRHADFFNEALVGKYLQNRLAKPGVI